MTSSVPSATPRVLIVGSDSPSSLESSYARALRGLGCAVHFWEPMAALYGVARGRRFGRLFSTFVQVEPWLRKSNLELLQLADDMRPDLVLVIGTGAVQGGTLAQLRVRHPRCLVYCLFPDSPHMLDTARIHCLPFFDRVTVSSPAWVEALARFGARRVQYLPFAADTALHRPADRVASTALAHDVAFIGTWRREREALLEQLADFDLCIWGSKYWRQRTRPNSPLRRRWAGRAIAGREFAEVCATSGVMLNIMDPATWPGPNMRTFEQPACRAFSLVTRSPAVLDLFTEGETIACFDSPDEAREKIVYYLRHADARRRIAEASYRFVTERGHTYTDRARQLLAWVAEDARG